VKSKKAVITNYYIEQSWSVSLKNIGRQNFAHNSHRTQSNPIVFCLLTDVSVTSDGVVSPAASKSLNNYLACFKCSARLSHLLSSTQ